MDGYYDAYGAPQEPSVHYFNGPSGEENNYRENEVAPGLKQRANGNTNLYETLIASQPRPGSSKIPGLHTTTPESADKDLNLEKAAMLREKLLASRRTSSRNVTPADNAKNTQFCAGTSQAGKSRVSGLEELIRRGREAAEKSLKQRGHVDDTKPNVLEQQIDLASPAKPATHPNHHEHTDDDTNVAPSAKVMASPMSNVIEKTCGASHDAIVPHHSQSKNGQTTIDQRASITVHKNISNGNHGIVPTIQTNRGAAPKDKSQSQTDDTKREAEEANDSVQLQPVNQLGRSLTNMNNDEMSTSRLDHSILTKYFSDLNEWLEITGYHDLPLRQRTLTRHRRRLQLEQELAQLNQEDEEDGNVPSRVGTIALLPPVACSSATRPTEITSGVLAHIPPTARTDLSTNIADASTAASFPFAPAAPSAPSNPIGDEPLVTAKRPHSASSDVHRPEKQQRTETGETSKMEKSFNRPTFHAPDNTTSARTPYSYSNRSQDREYQRTSDENNYRPRYDSEYDRPTHKQPSHNWHARASTVDPFSRDRYSQGGRSDTRTGTSGPFSSQRRFGSYRFSKSRGLNANVARSTLVKQPNSAGGKGSSVTRYFLIKSWNYDNVLTSQRDGVWATQPHNEDSLTEAFKTSKEVILIFSVNKSMAFQGYARMISLPGTAPPPQWTQQLLWKSSPPFNVQWITIAETRFSHTKHIKNALNEGQLVLIGRDGQEIDETAGRQLCELIDECGRRFGSRAGSY